METDQCGPIAGVGRFELFWKGTASAVPQMPKNHCGFSRWGNVSCKLLHYPNLTAAKH